jgi:AmmeMemoRadiSam system protein B
MKRPVVLWLALVLATGATGCGTASAPPQPPAAVAPLAAPSFDQAAFGGALLRLGGTPAQAMPGARVVVLPHHWLAGDLIVGALRDLAATAPDGGCRDGDGRGAVRGWRRVVVLSPDHYRLGPSVAFSASGDWSTPYGRLPVDAPAVAALAATGLVADRPDLMEREHGVAGLVPAVRRFLPGASVVPLAVRSDAKASEIGTLAAVVDKLAEDPCTVVLVSSDFAHDQMPWQARQNDTETVRALEALDVAAVRRFGDEHVDARAALAMSMAVAQWRGATRFVVRAESDGSLLAGYAGGRVTSYVWGFWAPPGP